MTRFQAHSRSSRAAPHPRIVRRGAGVIPTAGREAWREEPAPPAAEAPPEFLPPDAFEDLLGTRVWRHPGKSAEGISRDDQPYVVGPPEAVQPRRRVARGTPPQVERQPQPEPRAARPKARRTETALASLHEAAIRAPLARGKVSAKPKPPRPRRTEPPLDAQATIERPPPLDPR